MSILSNFSFFLKKKIPAGCNNPTCSNCIFSPGHIFQKEIIYYDSTTTFNDFGYFGQTRAVPETLLRPAGFYVVQFCCDTSSLIFRFRNVSHSWTVVLRVNWGTTLCQRKSAVWFVSVRAEENVLQSAAINRCINLFRSPDQSNGLNFFWDV